MSYPAGTTSCGRCGITEHRRWVLIRHTKPPTLPRVDLGVAESYLTWSPARVDFGPDVRYVSYELRQVWCRLPGGDFGPVCELFTYDEEG